MFFFQGLLTHSTAVEIAEKIREEQGDENAVHMTKVITLGN